MAVLISCLACVVLAQAATASVPAPATGPAYVSPFADYLRFEPDPPAKPWRAANDEVRDAGGHVGILNGMSRPAAATAAGKSPSGAEATGAPTKPAAQPAGKPAAPPHSHGGHQ